MNDAQRYENTYRSLMSTADKLADGGNGYAHSVYRRCRALLGVRNFSDSAALQFRDDAGFAAASGGGDGFAHHVYVRLADMIDNVSNVVPVRGVNLTREQYDAAKRCKVGDGSVITFIKDIRAAHGLLLKEAKDIAEDIMEGRA
jgi:hypothetical protein